MPGALPSALLATAGGEGEGVGMDLASRCAFAPHTLRDFAGRLQGSKLDLHELPCLAEFVAHEAGGAHLGAEVKGLSLALDDLGAVRRRGFAPTRTATMTADDLPDALAPLARALDRVRLASQAVENRLAGVEQASALQLGLAAMQTL